MRSGIFLILGLMLSACATLPLPVSPIALSPTLLQPSPSFTPSILTPSPTSTPTETTVPTFTPSLTSTSTSTGTPTSTEISFLHIFPLQPPSAGGFAEGTASHGYPATDIFAVVGTKFVAVTDGVVNFVSHKDLWDPTHDDPALRGGLSVAIIGDDGLRYYGSHLSAIAAGIAPGVQGKSRPVAWLGREHR